MEGGDQNDLVSTDSIKEVRKLVDDYESFVNDQIGYAKELEKIKHLILK